MIHTAEIAGATDVTSAHSTCQEKQLKPPLRVGQVHQRIFTLKTSTYRDEGVNSLPGLSS